MNRYPLISIITINYKQSAVTNQLLNSLQKISWPNYEVLVVDNNSGEGDAERINTNYNNVSLIKSKINLGFAGGNNLGIKQAKGDYILLLNNDTEVDPGFIEPMVNLFKEHKNVGAVSPKIKFYYDPTVIQYAGFTSINPFTLRMNAIGSKSIDNGSYNKVNETHFAHGCAMMVSREVIERAGLMPEEYFLYYEEHDWSTKILKAGYKIYYQPGSVVLHKESISVEKHSPLKTYYLNRNRILFMRRNFNGYYKLFAWAYLITVSVPKNILKYLLSLEFKHLGAYLDSVVWNLFGKTNSKWILQS